MKPLTVRKRQEILHKIIFGLWPEEVGERVRISNEHVFLDHGAVRQLPGTIQDQLVNVRLTNDGVQFCERFTGKKRGVLLTWEELFELAHRSKGNGTSAGKIRHLNPRGRERGPVNHGPHQVPRLADRFRPDRSTRRPL